MKFNICLLLLLFSFFGYSQTININKTEIDLVKNPFIGVSINAYTGSNFTASNKGVAILGNLHAKGEKIIFTSLTQTINWLHQRYTFEIIAINITDKTPYAFLKITGYKPNH